MLNYVDNSALWCQHKKPGSQAAAQGKTPPGYREDALVDLTTYKWSGQDALFNLDRHEWPILG